MDYNMVEGIQSISNNSTIHIEANPVVKNISGNNVSMYSYNGQIPGPLIKVKQGSSIYVNLTNNLDISTTVHWHGLRLNNSFDCVPGVTQKPIKPGGSFLYKLDFPDEGIYWYHPHMRSDIGQAMGLYGNILVEPLNNTYKPGISRILNILPEKNNITKIYVLGRVNVSDEESLSGKSTNFSTLKSNEDIIKEIEPFKKYLSVKPDYELDLTAKVLDPELASELGKMMGGTAEPIEWDEDEDMAMMNSMATSKNVEWIIWCGKTQSLCQPEAPLICSFHSPTLVIG